MPVRTDSDGVQFFVREVPDSKPLIQVQRLNPGPHGPGYYALSRVLYGPFPTYDAALNYLHACFHQTQPAAKDYVQ